LLVLVFAPLLFPFVLVLLVLLILLSAVFSLATRATSGFLGDAGRGAVLLGQVLWRAARTVQRNVLNELAARRAARLTPPHAKQEQPEPPQEPPTW
jgi:hypothetical protein